MTQSEAIDIAEGYIVAEDDEQYVAAWQQLINTGMCWRLQGWFGRTAMQMIKEGICSDPNRPAVKDIDKPCEACECTPCDCGWGNY